MKKIVILFLLLIFSLVPGIAAEGYEEDRLMATGVCGNAATWKLYESGRCVIEGYGSIYDRWNSNYYCSVCGWYHSSIWDGHYSAEYANEEGIYGDFAEDFSYRIKTIEFSGSIDSIGYGAFSYLSSLEEIELPSQITIIENSLFSGCSSLKSISIPEGVTQIGYSAFAGCSSLEGINIPDGITALEDNIFSDCTALKKIYISENIHSISSTAFSGCTSIEIEIAANNEHFSMENGLIMNKDKTKIVYVPASISGVFTIPEGVTVISEGLFSGNTQITEISMPDTVTKIERYAFENCSALSKINLPDSITEIGYWAFRDCISLKSVTIPPEITALDDVFEGCIALEQVELPDGIKTLNYTFQGCTSLSKIVLPDSLVSISGAFYDCTSLKSITVPKNVTEIYSAFYNCSSLENVILPSALKRIGEQTFYCCTSLKEIEIPDGVTEINDGAFSGCSMLEKIILPDEMTLIEDFAFSDCSSLKEIILPSKLKTIKQSAFANCYALQAISFPDTLTEISYNAFGNVPLFNPENITEDYYVSGWLVKACKTEDEEYLIRFNTKIMPGAFSDSGITKIRFEEGITAVQSYMFFENEELKHVVLPHDITIIGYSAFSGCSALETVEFLGKDVFNKETGEFVQLTSKLEKIEGEAFSGCGMLADFTFNESIKEIGYKAFLGCSSLKTLYIPSSMRVLEHYAFGGCTGLETVMIVPAISNYLEENKLWAYDGVFKSFLDDALPHVDALYLGQETYDYDLERLGIQANKTYYLHGCEYDINSKRLTGSPGAVLACADNGENFLNNVYSVKIADGTIKLAEVSDFTFEKTYTNFKNLREFILPDSLERIEHYALFGLSNLHLTIPANVNYISGLCGWSSDLLSIEVVPENPYFFSDGNEVYSKDGTVLYKTLSTADVYTIPECVRCISGFALNWPEQVIIHKNVTELKECALNGVLNVYYEGTESEWNEIQFSEYDSWQGIVHLNNGQKIPETLFDYNYPDYKITVSLPDINIKDGTMVLACGMNDDGKMSISRQSLLSADTQAELSIPQDATYIKIFVWEDMTTLKPLAVSEEVIYFSLY